MDTQFDSGLVWFRRDLRVADNAALALALERCARVHCVFVFDTDILDPLPEADRRVEFIQASVVELDESLRQFSGHAASGLIVLHGKSTDEIPRLAQVLRVHAVYSARDYEPAAQTRDAQVVRALDALGIVFQSIKDHVVFEGREILTQSGHPYGIYTPYSRAWVKHIGDVPPPPADSTGAVERLALRPASFVLAVPSLEQLGFKATNLRELGIHAGASGAQRLLGDFMHRLDRYGEIRDFPSVKGPSYLGVHLRFGTVSIRQLVNLAWQHSVQGSAGAQVWLKELVWREFYFQVLSNFPHVATSSFKPEYDRIEWSTGAPADGLFQAWCEGRTGYPLVDAAMLQLNTSGYMHNRLRMVAGSFLVKHLGIDWRKGERYFAQMLNDFDLAANNGGWQWVSSSGCDAQPYFRIFNPVSQSEKFDAQGKFIRRYLPQLAGLDANAIHAPWLAKPEQLSAAGITLGGNYPLPIVDHAQARASTLERYAVVKKSA
jgi:deoxyribodipyrimidine photo-lyase